MKEIGNLTRVAMNASSTHRNGRGFGLPLSLRSRSDTWPSISRVNDAGFLKMLCKRISSSISCSFNHLQTPIHPDRISISETGTSRPEHQENSSSPMTGMAQLFQLMKIFLNPLALTFPHSHQYYSLGLSD